MRLELISIVSIIHLMGSVCARRFEADNEAVRQGVGERVRWLTLT